MLVSIELATSTAALLLMAGAVLCESSEEERMAAYDTDWLEQLIDNLESFGGAIVGLADSASCVAALPVVQRADLSRNRAFDGTAGSTKDAGGPLLAFTVHAPTDSLPRVQLDVRRDLRWSPHARVGPNPFPHDRENCGGRLV